MVAILRDKLKSYLQVSDVRLYMAFGIPRAARLQTCGSFHLGEILLCSKRQWSDYQWQEQANVRLRALCKNGGPISGQTKLTTPGA